MAVLARILLRYLSGYLVLKGLFSADMGDQLSTDADILGWLEIGLGVAAAAVSEGWYYLAKKLGWST